MEQTPYLLLRERLSQTWINKNTIILALMAVKLVIFATSLQSTLETAKYYTLSSCPTIDSMASSAVSIPHYLSKSANYMIQKSIQEINDKTVDTLSLMLTGAEALIIFSLEMIVGTYACVLVSTIDGAVDVAVNGTESVISWVNGTLGNIVDEIEDGLGDLTKVINKVIDTAEKATRLFDDDDDDDGDTSTTFKKVNLTVASLRNLHIPSSINDKLEQLNENTPDFDSVKNKTEALIREPFDLVKKKITNATLISGDDEGLYTPALQNVQICSDNSDSINNFYNDLAQTVHRVMVILVVLMFTVALFVIIPSVISELRKWRKLQNLHNKLDFKSQELQPHDPITVFEDTFNRYPSTAGKFASKFSSNPSRQLSIRWFMSYIFSPRASIVLGLSLAGFLVIIAQFIMIKALESSISNQQSPFNSISSSLTSKVSESIANWTDSTNTYLETREDTINEDLFSWIQTTTDAVNITISTFVDDMNDAIANAFNGTILYDPVKTIVGCVIEDKLIRMEKGLTWVHDNAEISLPRVSEKYLSLAFDDSSNSTSANVTSSIGNSTQDYSQTALMSKTNELMDNAESLMGNILQKVITQYKKGLMIEVWIAVALFIIWLSQILIGGIMALFKLNQATAQDDGTISGHSNGSEKFTGAAYRAPQPFTISHPRPLNRDEQLMYGFPYNDPFKTPVSTTDLGIVKGLHDVKDPNHVKGPNPFRDNLEVATPQCWSSSDTVQQYPSALQDNLRVSPIRDRSRALYARQSSIYSTIHNSSSTDED